MIEATPTELLLVGDRLCTGCGFNLCGQRIVREARYALLVVPCPACGQVAPVEEFPPLDRWLSRWTMLLAALWLLGLIFLALASLLVVGGVLTAITVEITDRYDRVLWQESGHWATKHLPPGDAQQAAINLLRDREQFGAFWADRGDAVVAAHPPWASIERDELAMLLIPAGMALGVGILWSVVLLQWRRIALIATSWAIAALALAVVGVVWLALARIPMGSGGQAATVLLRLPMLAALVPIMVGLFDLGVLTGRPVARALVRAFLPPRLRGALGFLWTSDGRPAPWPPARALRKRP